jgi:predicted DNA-binding transcriptional regulator AlpA
VANFAAGARVGDSVAVGPSHSRKLLDLRAVLQRVPVSRARLYQLLKAGQFPRHWLEHELNAWVDALAEQRAA